MIDTVFLPTIWFYQYNVKQIGNEINDNHQRGDIVLIYHQILPTNIKRNVHVLELGRRVNILKES